MGRRVNPARAGRQQRWRRPPSAVDCLATLFHLYAARPEPWYWSSGV